jgi:hypothetical protein
VEGRTIGRLRPGVRVEAERAELNCVMREIVREYPADYAPDTSAHMEPLRDRLIGPVHGAIWMLLGAVALACANLANTINPVCCSR